MDVKRFYLVFLGGLSITGILLSIWVWFATAGQVTGAIFTTLADGSSVNANVYDDKEDVYLNGGPFPNRPCTAAGLPDGDYYFQVTDPSGHTLLSDFGDANGTITVSDSVISAYSGTHVTGIGQCSDVTVQLFPYDPTPNRGGAYKVWLTPVEHYTPGSGSFGFFPSESKTDNFKIVLPESTDRDGDGIPDDEDNCPKVFDPTNVCNPYGNGVVP